MATDAEIGIDFSCVLDMSPRATLVTGRRLLAEAVARRWASPRGSLPRDKNYGTEAAAWLNDDIDARGLASMRSQLIAEAKKEERVLDCDLVITAPPLLTGAYLLEATIFDADGPFDLTVSVSDVTVALLSVEE